MTVLFGVLIGLALGLTGAGGSIFGVPLLHYGLGLPLQQAVSVSLLAVALVAGLGAFRSVRSRMVSWRAVLVFGAGSMVGAPLGAWLGSGIEDRLLIPGFALIAVLVALRMLGAGRAAVPSRAEVGASAQDVAIACRLDASGQLRITAPCSIALLLAGLLTGLLSGIFGVGGGFLIVPALTLITQMSVHAAVGSSLVLIALTGGAGFAGKLLLAGSLPWLTTALYVAGGAGGMLLGQQIAARLSGVRLQRVFALLLLLVGVGMGLSSIVGG